MKKKFFLVIVKAMLQSISSIAVVLSALIYSIFPVSTAAQSTFSLDNTTPWFSPNDIEELNRDMKDRSKKEREATELRKREIEKHRTEMKQIQLENQIRRERKEAIMSAQRKAKELEEAKQARLLEEIRIEALREKAEKQRIITEYMRKLPQQDKDEIFKSSISARLYDPYSADFKPGAIYVPGEGLCGYVNAKNRFGGYVGFKIMCDTSFSEQR